MKKIILIFVLIMIHVFSFSQREKDLNNHVLLKYCYIYTFGINKYEEISDTNNCLFYVQVQVDSLGNIIDFPNHKIMNKGINESDLNLLLFNYKQNFKFQIWNPQGELNFDEFLRISDYKPKYWLKFNPFLIDKFEKESPR